MSDTADTETGRTTAPTSEFHDAAPMAADRTAGWRYFAAPGPVYKADGHYYLTSLEAVRFAHRNPDLFSSAQAFDVLGSPVPLIPIAVDQPDHLRYRRILDPMLAPKVINRLVPDLRRQAGELIDRFAGTGSCDIVTDLGKLYPTQVILTLFGLPLEDRDQFIAWTTALVEISEGEPSAEQLETGLALFTYLEEFVGKKRKAPGDDMLSSILALSGDEAWTEEEILGLCFLFTLAGLDTVTASIGFVMLHLAERPGLRREVVADPEKIGPVVEEVLRLELPAPFTPRVTTAEVEVEGVTIPAGANVVLALATANRGPERGELADEIDLAQGTRGHLSFGGGIHRCLGSHLARQELRLVVEEFHKRIPDYELAPGAQPQVVWPSGTLHLRSLPLVFPVGGAR